MSQSTMTTVETIELLKASQCSSCKMQFQPSPPHFLKGKNMLIEKIRKDRLKALKAKDEKKKNLLGVLIADACRDEKQPDDITVVRFVKKFIENAKENLLAFEKGSGSTASKEDAQREVEILTEYLPSQLTGEALIEAIRQVISLEAIEALPSNMGKVMKALGSHHAGGYDGKEASELVKGILSGKI
jgi:uncharacterized protein YqeY